MKPNSAFIQTMVLEKKLKDLNKWNMEIKDLINYSPVIMAVLVFLIQHHIFVTPEQLERKHREILEDAEEKFATLQELRDVKVQFGDIKCKIDRIYELLVTKD